MERKAITAIRILAADAIQKAKSGHPGLAIGSAPMAYALWKQMKHDPKHPDWPGRDRFVLSAGHGSMLEYALLHLYGYGLSMDDIKAFRQWGSKTPGHPEFGHTAGVEATTGPLGQGFATAVGMAIAEAHEAAVYNRDGFPIVDNYTFVLMGDGCMQEGVQAEAASLAGTLKLGKLIALYDSNKIQIEGSTDLAFTENVQARYEAYGWQVLCVEDGEDVKAIEAAIEAAKAETEKPSLIIVKTIIGRGTPNAGTAKVHGAPLGEENISIMRKNYGWEYGPFEIPEDVYAHFAALADACAKPKTAWDATFEKWAKKYPDLKTQWDADHSDALPVDLLNDEAFWTFEGKAATRASSGEVLNRLSKLLPNLMGGSADLAPSNCSALKDAPDFSAQCREGRNIHFGVREFAMAAAANGMALYGGLRPFCATFFVFSDYLKPAMRLSALMNLSVLYILTHDSIGVGEDGPTHEPIEQLAMLRSIPNVLTFRPADAKEVAAGYLAALTHRCPTALVLSRQGLPLLDTTGKGALKGGYVLREPKGTPDVILMASGSEVELLYKAADLLSVRGYTARIVSMPSMELFDQQDAAYRESVLSDGIRARVAVEAASAFGWQKYVGLDGEIVAMPGFGASAPGGTLFEQFGFTPEAVVEAALKTIKQNQK